MDLSIAPGQTQRLTCPQLPLAVYREVAAHLRQIAGVETNIIMRSLEPDPTEEFDYYQSQVAALEIGCQTTIPTIDRDRISEILDYYAQRYTPWKDLGGDTSGASN